MSPEISDRITIFESPEFTIELEYAQDFAIWHTARVNNFNRAAYRKMKDFADQLERFLRLHYDCLWTAMDPTRRDLARLAGHGGFVFHHHAEPTEEFPNGLDVYQKLWKEAA